MNLYRLALCAMFLLLSCAEVQALQTSVLSMSKSDVQNLQKFMASQNKKIKDEADEIDRLRGELEAIKKCIMHNSRQGIATTNCFDVCDELGFNCSRQTKEY